MGILREGVDGLDPPDRELHSFTMDINPEWGITLAARASFQFNVLVENNGFSWMDGVEDKVMLPFLMMEVGLDEPNAFLEANMNLLTTSADNLKSLVILV